MHSLEPNFCYCRRDGQQQIPQAPSQAPDGAVSDGVTSSGSSSSSEHDTDYDSCKDSAVNSSVVTVNCDKVTWQRQSSSTASTQAYAYRWAAWSICSIVQMRGRAMLELTTSVL